MKKQKQYLPTLPLTAPEDWQFSGDNAFAYLRNLADVIGPRLGATQGELEAAEYIKSVFKSFGLRAFLQKFPLWNYDCSAMQVRVRTESEGWHDIGCEAQMPCASTKGWLSAPLFPALDSYQQAMTPAVKGKIVLVWQNIPREERKRFLSYGPAALLIADQRYDGYLHRNAAGHTYAENFGTLPTLTITYGDALKLAEAARPEVKINLAESEAYAWGHNVIGEIKGCEDPEKIVLIGGHYDSHWHCPGATDNGGGTALVMELARLLSSKRPRYTLRFVLFSGEESGLHGSIAYAHALYEMAEKERKARGFKPISGLTFLDRHLLCVNIDVMGELFANNVLLYSGHDDLGASMRLWAKECDRQLTVINGPMSSDGTPFAAVGVPTVQYGRYGAPTIHGHTANDSTAHLRPRGLQISGDFMLGWLRRYIMDMKVFPFDREVPAKCVEDADKYFQGRRGRNPRDDAKKLWPLGDPKAKDGNPKEIK